MPTNNLKVSVIMSVYNGEKYLKEAIDSILSQSFTNFEFIIVNDCSTDSSLDIIRSYSDERIKIINNDVNIGLTKSLNKALSQAKGEYIARHDADDISLPNRFEEQVRYLNKYVDVAVLGTSICLIDETGKTVRKQLALIKPNTNDFFKGNQISHGSAMFRKAIMTKLDAYNELFKYGQDYELWLRVARDYKLRNLPEMLYQLRFHRQNIGFMNRDESSLYHILALRLMRNDTKNDMLKAIENNGIKHICTDLNDDEKILFYGKNADLHLINNNLKLAQKQYMNIFKLNPFNIKNNVCIVCSYFGKWMMEIISNIYKYYQNYIIYIRNYIS